MSRSRRSLTTLAAVAAAAAVLLVSGCSGSSPAPQGSPSITFGPDVSTTPGMAGHGMTGAPAPAPVVLDEIGISAWNPVAANSIVHDAGKVEMTAMLAHRGDHRMVDAVKIL